MSDTMPVFQLDGQGEDATLRIVGEWPERITISSALALTADRRWLRWQMPKEPGFVGSLVRFRLTNSAATYRVTAHRKEPFLVDAVRVWQRPAPTPVVGTRG